MPAIPPPSLVATIFISLPLFIINGDPIGLQDAFTSYRLKVPSTPGPYKVPVKYKFTDPNLGKEEKGTVIVEYDVAKDCNP